MAKPSPGKAFEELLDVIEALLGPEGCPWDRAQTHQSLKRYLIEEAYEVYEAIEENQMDSLQDELGDVLLQVVLHSLLGQKAGTFDITDVVRGVEDKMIRRHPHVFGEGTAETPGEVEHRWEQIKKMEKAGQGRVDTLMDVPRNLSPLYRAEKIQNRARRVGFGWEEPEGILEKIEEECREIKEALEKEQKEEIREELGDLLFSVVNLCSFLDIDPADALQQTNDKFIRRFRFIEEQARQEDRNLQEMTLEEMETHWNAAKKP